MDIPAKSNMSRNAWSGLRVIFATVSWQGLGSSDTLSQNLTVNITKVFTASTWVQPAHAQNCITWSTHGLAPSSPLSSFQLRNARLHPAYSYRSLDQAEKTGTLQSIALAILMFMGCQPSCCLLCNLPPEQFKCMCIPAGATYT